MYNDRFAALLATGLLFPSDLMLGLDDLPNAARDADSGASLSP